MSGPFGSSQWMYKSGDYEIDNSLRFNPSESPYLSRTPSAGNRKTWTFSTWIKRGNLGIDIDLLHAYADSGERSQLVFAADDTIKFDFDDYTANRLTTTQKFRDASAWYHIVLAVDTTQGTAANRVKIYVNGNQISEFSAAGYPSENEDGHINSAIQHEISSYDGSGSYLDGYLAEVNFIEGTALDASYFGETGDYGEWKPKKYSGAYGNEGFYLDFKSSGVGTASSSTVGADRSGNDNHWTSTNITATDQMLDSPTNNFCTWNPLFFRYNVANAYTEGNTKISFTSSGTEGTGFGSIGGLTSGKWYWEVLINAIGSGTRIGISNSLLSSGNSPTDFREFLDNHDGTGKNTPGTFTNNYGNAFGDGDIIGVGLDIDNGTLTFFKNNTSQGVAFTNILSAIPEGGWMPMGRGYGSPVNTTNWGQDSTFAGVKTAGDNADANSIGNFFYAPPSGHLALCTKNLPEPDVVPSENFNTITYTGDDQTGKAISGVGFAPDFLWFKERQGTAHHVLHDSVRGASGGRLSSNRTNAEDASNSIASFDSDGFTVGASAAYINSNNANIVAWNWKANGVGASNTNGTINTTKTSANVDAGFSIATYTGTNDNGATIGHGLSKAPEMLIVKARSASGENWRVYHSGLANYGTDAETDVINLNLTDAVSDAASIWNDTAPTSSVFSVGEDGGVNADGTTYVAYCFHSVDGHLDVGSYIGNGNAEGTFVYTGFRVAMVIRKRIDDTTHWHINDNARIGFNGAGSNLSLRPNVVDDEDDADRIDLLSNGFKVRTTSGDANNNNSPFIYIAFAETPFKYSNAR